MDMGVCFPAERLSLSPRSLSLSIARHTTLTLLSHQEGHTHPSAAGNLRTQPFFLGLTTQQNTPLQMTGVSSPFNASSLASNCMIPAKSLSLSISLFPS